MPDDVVLAGRVVQPAERLLDVDRAHHAPAVPRHAFGMRGYRQGVDAATIAGLLADPARLKVVAALALGADTIEDVSAASGLSLKDVALALAPLREAWATVAGRS